MCVAVRVAVCVARCCRILQCVALCCTTFTLMMLLDNYERTAGVLQRALQCVLHRVLQCVSVCFSLLQFFDVA